MLGVHAFRAIGDRFLREGGHRAVNCNIPDKEAGRSHREFLPLQTYFSLGTDAGLFVTPVNKSGVTVGSSDQCRLGSGSGELVSGIGEEKK
jgi:hypothetical protein